MFTEEFGRYVCEGNRITCEVDGFKCTATLYRDDCNDTPWERDCGHGPVSSWTNRGKAPGERVLSVDRESKRFYDFAEAVKIAMRDGWGVEGGRNKGETKKAYAARAAEHDFDVLKAWCNDEWHYFGVAVTVSKAGVGLTGRYDHALWGVDGNYPGSDNSYLATVANEQLGEALDAARAKLAVLCGCGGEG